MFFYKIVIRIKLSHFKTVQRVRIYGLDGGEYNTLYDVNLIAIAEDTPRIQEMHILIGHTLCHLIELEFSSSK